MRRVFDPGVPERMDIAREPDEELRRDLENLRRLNAWFGGVSVVLGALRRWLHPGDFARVLDLGTGYADIPRSAVDWARGKGIRLLVEAVDANPAVLEVARSASASYPEISFRAGNLLDWRASGDTDILLCTLALHHFSNDKAIHALRSFEQSGARRILVSDLRRGFMQREAIRLLTSTFLREPMTRHDAMLSINRAFSFAELGELAKAAGWRNFVHRREGFARQSLQMER